MQLINKIRIFVMVLTALVSCNVKTGDKTQEQETTNSKSSTGIATEEVDVSNYSNVLYVDISSTSEAENGAKDAPFKSISKAASQSLKENTAIIIAGGTYNENTIDLVEGVSLFGGFNSKDWTRDITLNETTIIGTPQQRILTTESNTKIDGLIFSDGLYRGPGGAIYINESASVSISNNVFIRNTVLGPLDWNPEYWHETANNGGAIYGENSASVSVKGNIFINNRAENGRGAAVAFDNKCKVSIANNVFVKNIAGTNDPMRSSDGGGISVFNWCDADISDNIFLGNKALAKNDGGAVFVALWSSARINNNILVDSESGDDAGALFVGGQEHRYGGAPLDPIPPKDKFYVTVDNNQFYGNKNSSMNSGAMRYTMESRGEFTNNKLAYNNGVYFQRSEVAVSDNVILDNFLFIETKEGLNQGSIENNFIWGDFELTTAAKVEGNLIRDGFDGGKNNSQGVPNIVKDGYSVNVISSTVQRKKEITDLLVEGVHFEENELVNKVIKSGDKWGIVISNTSSSIKTWGSMFGVDNIDVLPSYTIAK